MKAVRVVNFGGPEVLEVKEIDIPSVGEDEVLVKVYAAGVNPVETYIRNGAYSKLPQLPFTPGFDGSGIVESIGRNVDSKISIGMRVYVSGSSSGTYAQFCVSNQKDVHPLPSNISFTSAAGIGVVYRTAYRSIFSKAKVKKEDTVLIHGASGGVGIAAIQLLRAHGCQNIIGTASTEKGMDLIRKQGAKAVNHSESGYIQNIKSLTPNCEGVDVILEMAAHKNLGNDLTILKNEATVVVIGNKGMTETSINARALMLTNSKIVGVLGVGSSDELKDTFSGINDYLQKGLIDPVVGMAFPMEKVSDSHIEVIEHREGTCGKIILDIKH